MSEFLPQVVAIARELATGRIVEAHLEHAGERVRLVAPPADSYDVMADALCEVVDAARQAFIAAGFDPGEWDGDNIVQDVKRGLVAAIEQLARERSATTFGGGQDPARPA